MEKWLLRRLFENNKDQPVPRFAFQSTVNWMASLSILSKSSLFSNENLNIHYQSVRRRKLNKDADTWTYENILMALHNIAALNEMSSDYVNKVAIVRSAIVAWYYAVYYSASGMVAAASGSKQETHAATAKVWQNDIVNKNLAISPFGLRLNTLVQKDVKSEIASLRNGNNFDLVNSPQTESDAWGAVYGYLSGTADYEKWRIEERVRDSKEFKKLNVNNFRTKAARELRDTKLKSGIVNFLVQAFRYRGKANYRDSIYLSYGESRSDIISIFVKNLGVVATTFSQMACFYISRRVDKQSWNDFSQDLQNNLTIKIDSNIFKI